MKQKLLLLSLLISGLMIGQEIHIDFDNNNPGVVLNSWNGSSTFAKIANPDVSAENASPFVGQFTAGSDNGIGIGIINPETG